VEHCLIKWVKELCERDAPPLLWPLGTIIICAFTNLFFLTLYAISAMMFVYVMGLLAGAAVMYMAMSLYGRKDTP
jgi:hypothetical protein